MFEKIIQIMQAPENLRAFYEESVRDCIKRVMQTEQGFADSVKRLASIGYGAERINALVSEGQGAVQ